MCDSPPPTSTESLRRLVAALALVLFPSFVLPTTETLGQELPSPAPVPATVDVASVESVAALGDSFIAGFSSGSLVEDVQVHSIPARLAEALNISPFEQPLVAAPGIPPRLEVESLDPLRIGPADGSGTPINLDLERPYDNLAVPGFRLADVLESTNGNALADLILRGNGTAVDQLLGLDADLVLVGTFGEGLTAVSSGIVVDGVTLTPAADFEAQLHELLMRLDPGELQVVLLEIPQVEGVPFATSVPPVLVDPVTGDPVLDGGETVPLLGPDGPLGSGDRVLLSARSSLDSGIGIPTELGGTGEPLPGSLVLSAAEATSIRDRVDAYNRSLRTLAREFGATVVAGPARAFERETEVWRSTGCDGGSPQPFGAFFSLDGLHPSAQGYRLLANALLEDLERANGVDLPMADESICLSEGRFEVSARWSSGDGQISGVGHPVPVSQESGHFWFFDEGNVELTVKVLDGCAITGSHWLFAGGLTDLAVELTITDRLSGDSTSYASPAGSPFASVLDFVTFASCP